MNNDELKVFDTLSNRRIWLSGLEIVTSMNPKQTGNIHMFVNHIEGLLTKKARAQNIPFDYDMLFGGDYQTQWHVILEIKKP